MPLLKSLRIDIEILKQLVRMEHELGISQAKIYLFIEGQLQEISKMVNGWLKYMKEETR